MLPLPTVEAKPRGRRLPDWLKKPLPAGNENSFTHHLIDELGLTTMYVLAAPEPVGPQTHTEHR